MTAIAITGVTGNFGHGLVPLLESAAGVDRIVGLARRPFEPAQRGWSKLEYREGDVRDRAGLRAAFAGTDAVAHLAFARFGHAPRETLHAINVVGTMNAFAAAAEARVRRFAFASSVAAYGFHADNPIPITEDWPARGSERWFYAREKAELELQLEAAAGEHPGLELTIFRPTIVVGPQTAATIGDAVPPALRGLVALLRLPLAAVPAPLPVPAFPQPLQFVHEQDVGQAFLRALVHGPPGTYNLAGDGIVDGGQVVRELGLAAIPVPAAATRALAAALVRLPRSPAALEAAEIATHPVIVDATRAKERLGWRPRYTGIEALRAALSHRDNAAGADQRGATSVSAQSADTVGRHARCPPGRAAKLAK
jgi:nucleoside-diphosphate-sugar epimerase